MRIGIIGAGKMAAALGTGWATAGHDVLVGERTPGRAVATGLPAADLLQAATYGEATLLAIPATAVGQVLGELGDRIEGTLIDCGNAFEPDAGGAMTLGEEALAERVAGLAPRARVVKAFNVCAAEVWAARGVEVAVPLCGDDPGALDTVAGLVSDLGFLPMRAGGLASARYLEAMAALVVGLWFAGHDARQALPPLDAAFAVPD